MVIACDGTIGGYEGFGCVYADSNTTLASAEFRAEFGTMLFNSTNGLVTALDENASTADDDYYEDIGDSTVSYATVSKSSEDTVNVGDGTITKQDSDASYVIWYSEDGGSDMLAKTGTYTIRYRLTYGDDSSKGTVYQTFSAKVTNSLTVPTVNVATRTADSLDADGIIKCLETEVDMNNNTSLHESIPGVWYKDSDGNYVSGPNTDDEENPTSASIGYVEVVDTASVSGETVEWHFLVKKTANA